MLKQAEESGENLKFKIGAPGPPHRDHKLRKQFEREVLREKRSVVHFSPTLGELLEEMAKISGRAQARRPLRFR